MTVRSSVGAARRKRRAGGTGHRRLGARTIILAGVAVALAACGPPGSPSGSGSPPSVANLGTSGGPSGDASAGTGAGTSAGTSAGSTSTTLPKGADATRAVDAWASCMRSHGDPNQADPTIDIHGVIHIVIGAGASQALASEVKGGVDQQVGTCSQFLSAAQRVLRQSFPVSPPPDSSALLNYAACMRANGVPNYPDPTGEKTKLSGVDTNSPTFLKASDICGKKVDAPAWWIDGWGPPGDVSVRGCYDGNQAVACPKGFPPAGGGPGSNG